MADIKLVDYLQSRDLSKLKIDDPAELSDFLAELNSKKKVHTLHLSDGKISIGKDVAAAVGNALVNHGELEELHMVAAFKGRDISEVTQCLEAISAGVAQSGCRLRVLNMSENALRGTGIRGLEKMLTGPSCYALEVLNMSDQGLSPEGARELANLLKELLENARNDGQQLVLHTFKASKNRLENAGGIALGSVFKELRSLQEVEMYQCGITAEGVSSLMQGLAHNLRLRFLDIVDNTANGKAEATIAQAVEKWSELEDVRINSCLISGKGMVNILSSVKRSCPSIKTLDLGENEIGKGVTTEVIDLLTQLSSLQALVLKGNPFFQATARQLLQKRFAEMGKPDILKSKLGSHTYGLEESDNDEEEENEDGEEEAWENERDSVRSTGKTPSTDEVDEQDEADDFLLEREADGLWSLRLSIPDREEGTPSLLYVDAFGRRLERNNCFIVLGYLVHDLNKLFEERNYQGVFVRITSLALEYAEKLSEEKDDSKRLIVDHQLEALLQYTEYLCTYGMMQVGNVVFEEFFSACELMSASGKAPPSSVAMKETQLAAAAWILRHVLYGKYIPLYTLALIKDRIDSPKNEQAMKKLNRIEGFPQVFTQIDQQLA